MNAPRPRYSPGFIVTAHRTSNRSRRGRTPRIAPIAIIALLTALVVPAGASATRGLTTGFSDTDTDVYQGAADIPQRNLWLDRTVAAGAGIVRLGVEWPAVAPTRPPDPTNPASASYDFSGIDSAVTAAEAHGLTVLLSVNHAPDWAEAPGRPANATLHTWKPNPADLADFAKAVATRYSGTFMGLPAVQAIEVWDEPNSSDWLNPQFEGNGYSGAAIYRSMLNAAYDAIKSVNPGVQVVVGATAPYGDDPGGPFPNGLPRSHPVQFWQQVLCVKPVKVKKKGKKPATVRYVRGPGCTGPVKFDVFAHHPIDNTGKGPLQSGPSKNDASTPDLARVVSVLRGAEKARTTLRGKHPVWVTEFWWDSKPPNPVGAPLAVQARWIEQSLYLFWKAGASVAINFQINDGTERPDVHAGFQSGVYFADGRPKPSLTAFRFPFVTERISTKALIAWGKAPARGKLLVQRRQGSRWIAVKRLRVAKGAVFTAKLPLAGKQQLRAIVAGQKSLVWKQAAAVTGGKDNKGSSGLPSAIVVALIAAGALALILMALRMRQRRRIARRASRRVPAKPA